MSKGLTFLSLKCVLEHLEANRRIHIAARCPALRKTERSLPLHIDNLVFKDREIILNNMTYGIQTVISDLQESQTLLYAIDRYGNRDKSADKLVLPGDIFFKTLDDFGRDEELEENLPLKPSTLRLYSEYIEIAFECNRKVYRKRVPKNLKFHVALKQLSCFLLGNRRDIRVNQLKVELNKQKVLRLPLGLKLSFNCLDTGVHSAFTLRPIMRGFDSPLKEHKVCVNKKKHFKLFSKTEVVTIIDHENDGIFVPWSRLLPKVQSKKVVLKSLKLSKNEIIRIVQRLISAPYEIGKCYMLELPERIKVNILLNQIEKRFNGEAFSLKEIDERQLFSFLCMYIPINSTSELCISVVKDPSDGRKQIKLEIMSVESPIPF